MEKVFSCENCTIKYSPISVEKGLDIISEIDFSKVSDGSGPAQSIAFIRQCIGSIKDLIISANIGGVEMTKEQVLGDFDNASYVVAFSTHLLNSLTPSSEKKRQ